MNRTACSPRPQPRQRVSAVLAVLIALVASLLASVATSAPARAVGTWDNALVATKAELTADGAWGGQCKAFVNAAVMAAGGVSLSGYITGYSDAGGETVSSADATKGDIIQVTPAGSDDSTVESLYSAGNTALHTAIIVKNNGSGSFDVVDSNWSNSNDELVRHHVFTPYTWAAGKPGGGDVRIWRMGTATTSGAGTVPWNFETLDGDANSLLGNTGDLGRNPAVITYNNALHIFHYDATAGVLRHDWSDASGWHQQIVDGGGGYNTGATPTAVVFNGALHVFYNTPGNGQLRHAWGASGSTWTKETLDGPGNVGVSGNITVSVGQSPAAVVSGTTLHVFYTDVTGGNLRYGKISVGSGWTLQTLDGAPGTLGNWNAYTGIDPAVTLYNGTVQVLYYDSQYGNLRHAWLSGSSWFFENLEGDPGSVSHFNSDIGRNPTITALSTGLQAFYRDAQYGNLRHAWTDAAGWHFENLDGDVGSVSHREAVTGFTPAAVASGGQLQLFYYEQSGGNLRHAFTDASGWHFEDLDGSGGQPAGRLSTDVGLDPAVTLFGSVQVFYYDLTSGNLRHTWSQ